MIPLAGLAPAAPQFPWWPECSGKTLSEFNGWQQQHLQQMHNWFFFHREKNCRPEESGSENPHHAPAPQKDPSHSSELWTFTEHLSPFIFVTGNCTWCKLLHTQPILGGKGRWMLNEEHVCLLPATNFTRRKTAKTDNPECCHDKVLQKKTRTTPDHVAHCYFHTYLSRTRLEKYLFFLQLLMWVHKRSMLCCTGSSSFLWIQKQAGSRKLALLTNMFNC